MGTFFCGDPKCKVQYIPQYNLFNAKTTQLVNIMIYYNREKEGKYNHANRDVAIFKKIYII